MKDKPDYNKSKIFIICSKSTDKVYYGATVHALDDVLHKHTHNFTKSRYESGPIVKYGNATIQHVEFYPCSSVEELEDRHAYYIMNNRDKCINKRIPGTARRTAGGKISYYNNIIKKHKELHKKKYLRKDVSITSVIYAAVHIKPDTKPDISNHSNITTLAKK